ncbi:MAG: hypothetical protein IPK83_21740 [Planctomycetes bacterium]|nr:hypothetical protein [Planctomycetota bacterium]
MSKKKTSDCVEMKRQAQRKIREQLRETTREEELAYFRARGEALQKRIDAA